MSDTEPPQLAVFHARNLPAHPSNPDTDALLERGWPRSPGGREFMPMCGTFLVQAADGSQQECTDGFLTVGADGFPVWSAAPPG